MSDQQIPPAVVIDNGSGMCKAGIAGEDAPKTCFPCIVGRPKMVGIIVGSDNKQTYIGEQAMAKKGVLKINYPVEHGIVNSWQDMQAIWHHCYYNQLRVTPSEHPCLLTQAPRNPKNNRQKMTQIIFQKFNVPMYHLSIQAVLSLYSSGRTTGLVLDSGDGVTHTVPIYDGFAMVHAIQRNDLAGRDLTAYLQTLLNQIGKSFSSSSQVQIVRSIKQKLCYVALDFEKQEKSISIQLVTEEKSLKEQPYQLPDGQIIHLGSQMYRCPQALYNPAPLGKQLPGFHQLVLISVQKCDIDIRKQLYANIVMSGGSTMFRNNPERLQLQVTKKVPSTIKVKIHAPPERKYSVWIGGSILSSLASFHSMWITNAQYQQVGSAIVHRKCF